MPSWIRWTKGARNGRVRTMKMKQFWRSRLGRGLAAGSVVLGLAAGFAGAARAAGEDKVPQTPIYDTSADGKKQVAAALVEAKAGHKRVLIQFGANWCIWCHRLHTLFQSDAAVAAELKQDYLLILVDVDRSHNQGLVDKYQAQKLGLPSLVVLDEAGKHLKTQETGALEEGKDHHSPAKVLAFLREFAPKH